MAEHARSGLHGKLQALLFVEIDHRRAEGPKRKLNHAILVRRKLAARDDIGRARTQGRNAHRVALARAPVDKHRRRLALSSPARVGEHVVVSAFGHERLDASVDHEWKGAPHGRRVADDVEHVAVVDVLLERHRAAVAGV